MLKEPCPNPILNSNLDLKHNLDPKPNLNLKP